MNTERYALLSGTKRMIVHTFFTRKGCGFSLHIHTSRRKRSTSAENIPSFTAKVCTKVVWPSCMFSSPTQAHWIGPWRKSKELAHGLLTSVRWLEPLFDHFLTLNGDGFPLHTHTHKLLFTLKVGTKVRRYTHSTFPAEYGLQSVGIPFRAWQGIYSVWPSYMFSSLTHAHWIVPWRKSKDLPNGL